LYKDIFVGSGATTGTLGITTTKITGINTTGINVGTALSEVSGVIGAGVTVLSIQPTQITISRTSLNVAISTITVAFGSTSFISYSISEYDKRDIYDSYSDNDEFETEADAIIDFAESNPFGTF